MLKMAVGGENGSFAEGAGINANGASTLDVIDGGTEDGVEGLLMEAVEEGMRADQDDSTPTSWEKTVHNSQPLHPLVLPDTESFNIVISACERAWDWEHALLLLQQMRQAPYLMSERRGATGSMTSTGVPRTTETYNMALRCCDKCWQLKSLASLLQEMEREAVPKDAETYRLALRTCDKSGTYARSIGLLDEMKAEGVPRSVEAYTACLNSLARSCGGGSTSAAALTGSSRREGKQGQSEQHAGQQWRLALDLVQQMEEAGVSSIVEQHQAAGRRTQLSVLGAAYTAAVRVCARCGEWEEVVKLLKTMCTRPRHNSRSQLQELNSTADAKEEDPVDLALGVALYECRLLGRAAGDEVVPPSLQGSSQQGSPRPRNRKHTPVEELLTTAVAQARQGAAASSVSPSSPGNQKAGTGGSA
jgi:pentatricopeptide repeat protein